MMSTPANSLWNRQHFQKTLHLVKTARNGGVEQSVRRGLGVLPCAAQNYRESPYFDMSLYSYDEKCISHTDRLKPMSEFPAKVCWATGCLSLPVGGAGAFERHWAPAMMTQRSLIQALVDVGVRSSTPGNTGVSPSGFKPARSTQSVSGAASVLPGGHWAACVPFAQHSSSLAPSHIRSSAPPQATGQLHVPPVPPVCHLRATRDPPDWLDIVAYQPALPPMNLNPGEGTELQRGPGQRLRAPPPTGTGVDERGGGSVDWQVQM